MDENLLNEEVELKPRFKRSALYSFGLSKVISLIERDFFGVRKRLYAGIGADRTSSSFWFSGVCSVQIGRLSCITGASHLSSSGVCLDVETGVRDKEGPRFGTVSPVCADPKDPMEKRESVDDRSHRSTEPAVEVGVDGVESAKDSTNKVSEIWPSICVEEVLIGDKINSRTEELLMARSFSFEVVMIVKPLGR